MDVRLEGLHVPWVWLELHTLSMGVLGGSMPHVGRLSPPLVWVWAVP